MTTHTQLPIYKVAYDLLDVATSLVKNMQRDFKRSIGDKITTECIEITVLIFRANVAQEKAPHLLELIERLQVVELMIRLAKDKRLISSQGYANAIELTTSIGKQANGWRKSALRPLHGGQGRCAQSSCGGSSLGGLARWIKWRSHAMPKASTLAHCAAVSRIERCSSRSSGGVGGRPRGRLVVSMSRIVPHLL